MAVDAVDSMLTPPIEDQIRVRIVTFFFPSFEAQQRITTGKHCHFLCMEESIISSFYFLWGYSEIKLRLLSMAVDSVDSTGITSWCITQCTCCGPFCFINPCPCCVLIYLSSFIIFIFKGGRETSLFYVAKLSFKCKWQCFTQMVHTVNY